MDPINIASSFFASILETRAKTGLPSRLSSELAARSQLAVRWGETISKYLRVVTDSRAAVNKLESDLLGRAGSDVQNRFDEYFFDQLREYASVVSIAKEMKFRDWIPIVSGSKKSPDYKATTDAGQDCCVEVKTARAPLGVVDVVACVYNRLKSQDPNGFSFRLVVSHYWDNTATPEQKDFLGGFVASLSRTRVGESHQVVIPGNVEVKFTAAPGEGVMLSRGIGPDLEPENNPPGLLNKIGEKARGACLQLKGCAGSQFLALNVETPDGMIDQDIVRASVATIASNAPGVKPILLLHCHVLNIANIVETT